MDEVWRQAPCPALRRWCSSVLRWEINAAARRWGLRHGVTEADWQTLAEAGNGAPGRLALGPWSLWRSVVTLPDGTLWWLATEDADAPLPVDEDAASSGHEPEQVGLFERDLGTGEGHWDAAIYRMYGLDPADGMPSRDAARRHAHPDDALRLALVEQATASATAPCSWHYRIVRSNGEVRHLHAVSRLQPGADGRPGRIVGALIDETDRVVREQRLRETGALLSQAVQLAAVLVWMFDPAIGRVRYLTNAGPDWAYEAPDVSPRVISVDESRMRVHPDDMPQIVGAMTEALGTDGVVDRVVRYRLDEGGWGVVLTRRVAQRTADGSVSRVLGVSLDVTALEQQRQQARALQERSEALSDALGLGLFSHDPQTGVTECNAQMYRLYGLPPGEAVLDQAQWDRLVHPEDRERMARARQQADTLAARDTEVEFRIVRPDGQVRWISSWARRDEIDGRRRIHGVHFDVTERRRTEQALQHERERARFAMEVAGVGIWERVQAGRVGDGWYWNEHMYRLRGLDPADPRPIDELLPLTVTVEDQARIDAEYQRHLASGRLFAIEHQVRWPDGSMRWIATRGRVLRDAAGAPQTMIGINLDITERKEAERLWLEHQRVEQASRAKSEFMARVSHELRTPMNAVLGFTQLLARDLAEPPSARQRQRLQHIEAAGHHLLALIDEVLDLASIEAADRPLALDVVSLDGVVGDTLQWVAAQAQRSGVRLSRGKAVLDGQVLADRRRLGQIATNLLTNAVKYNHDGGWVRIDTRSRPRAQGGTEWGLVVRDGGRGLSPQQLERLFEPFNRLGAEREDIPGTGIGLAIVRQLVQRMGGSVEVDSAAGVGSEFRVWLPAANGEPGLQPQAAVVTPERGAPPAALSMLYIEDNPVNTALVCELVALRPEIHLSCVETGLEGLEAARRLQPDVVLLDLLLPDLPGLEVLRRLRADPRCAGATVIALSANALPEDIRQALAGGFDAYWTKPIDFTGFLASLDELAARRRLVPAEALQR